MKNTSLVAAIDISSKYLRMVIAEINESGKISLDFSTIVEGYVQSKGIYLPPMSLRHRIIENMKDMKLDKKKKKFLLMILRIYFGK